MTAKGKNIDKMKNKEAEQFGWVSWEEIDEFNHAWVFIDENQSGPDARTVLYEKHHLKIFSEDVQVLFEGQVVPECCTGNPRGPVPDPKSILGESPFSAIVSVVGGGQ